MKDHTKDHTNTLSGGSEITWNGVCDRSIRTYGGLGRHRVEVPPSPPEPPTVPRVQDPDRQLVQNW